MYWTQIAPATSVPALTAVLATLGSSRLKSVVCPDAIPLADNIVFAYARLLTLVGEASPCGTNATYTFDQSCPVDWPTETTMELEP